MQQRRQRRAHGSLHLIGVADHPCDRLAGARALEVTERQGLQVPEQTNAQIADDAFLNRDAAERREIRGEVLEQQRHQQHDHDVAERELRGTGLEEGSRDLVEYRLDLRAALRRQRRIAEQRAQERDQQDEREAVEHRRDDCRSDRGGEQQRVRSQERQQPRAAFGAAHQRERRGVSSATGKIISSGVAPPWRNAPR